MNIASWVKRWSELHPNKTAIIFEGDPISYLDLHQRINRTCCWLQSLGIEKGDRVAVMLSNCPEFLELYLACSRLGALFVPVNYRLAAPELDYTLGNSRPRLFVFGKDFSETVLDLNLNNRRPPMLLDTPPALAAASGTPSTAMHPPSPPLLLLPPPTLFLCYVGKTTVHLFFLF